MNEDKWVLLVWVALGNIFYTILKGWAHAGTQYPHGRIKPPFSRGHCKGPSTLADQSQDNGGKEEIGAGGLHSRGRGGSFNLGFLKIEGGGVGRSN